MIALAVFTKIDTPRLNLRSFGPADVLDDFVSGSRRRVTNFASFQTLSVHNHSPIRDLVRMGLGCALSRKDARLARACRMRATTPQFCHAFARNPLRTEKDDRLCGHNAQNHRQWINGRVRR